MLASSGTGTCKSHPAENPFSADRAARVLLVGTGPIAVNAVSAMRRASARVVVGAIDYGGHSDLAEACPDIPWLGKINDLHEIVLKQRINEVQVTVPFESTSRCAPELRAVAREFGIPVSFRVDWPEERVVARRGGFSVARMICLNQHAARETRWRIVKRLLDVTMAALSLLLLAPLFLAVAMAIKATSRGPVFFRQARVGLGRRVFQMYKFRTMVVNAEALRSHLESMNDARGISFKIIKDPRLTRIGSFLRRASIDEIPQLINVLLGEMSMVGPRPIPLWVAEQLHDTRWFRRFMVLPGMSGLWQVEGRQQDFDLMASKDLRYVDEWSLGLDLRILASTIPAVLKGVNAH